MLRVNDSLSLHFTGFKILEGVFDELADRFGFDQATDLLLSGCSAGHVCVCCVVWCQLVSIYKCVNRGGGYLFAYGLYIAAQSASQDTDGRNA